MFRKPFPSQRLSRFGGKTPYFRARIGRKCRSPKRAGRCAGAVACAGPAAATAFESNNSAAPLRRSIANHSMRRNNIGATWCAILSRWLTFRLCRDNLSFVLSHLGQRPVLVFSGHEPSVLGFGEKTLPQRAKRCGKIAVMTTAGDSGAMPSR